MNLAQPHCIFVGVTLEMIQRPTSALTKPEDMVEWLSVCEGRGLVVHLPDLYTSRMYPWHCFAPYDLLDRRDEIRKMLIDTYLEHGFQPVTTAADAM